YFSANRSSAHPALHSFPTRRSSDLDDGAGGADQACATKDVPGSQTPHLSITKSADPTSYNAVGQLITYTIVATNDGNTTLHNVTPGEPTVSVLTCTPVKCRHLPPDA